MNTWQVMLATDVLQTFADPASRLTIAFAVFFFVKPPTLLLAMLRTNGKFAEYAMQKQYPTNRGQILAASNSRTMIEPVREMARLKAMKYVRAFFRYVLPTVPTMTKTAWKATLIIWTRSVFKVVKPKPLMTMLPNCELSVDAPYSRDHGLTPCTPPLAIC